MSKLTRIGKFFKASRDNKIIDDPKNHDVTRLLQTFKMNLFQNAPQCTAIHFFFFEVSKIGSRLSDQISKKIIIGRFFFFS
jgi:hypothetical protein